MTSLWQTLPKPIFSLAPMEDVTDTVLRQIFCITGKPDVFFTEFTNVDGMSSQGRDIVARRLLFTDVEHPIIAQIWGMKPENYYTTAKDLVAKGFDGIDINMGCPQHDVVSHGACSALMKNHDLAKEIIQATKEGAAQRALPGGSARDLPVSVKTRIGFKHMQTEEWIGFLLEQDLDLITIHGRTAAEMSKVPTHWDEIGKAVVLRDEFEKKNNYSSSERSESRSLKGNSSRQARTINHTLIFGNGDVMSLKEAKEKVAKYHVDGVMIGRGIFHNPWLFAGIDPNTKSLKERLILLDQHVKLYRDTWGSQKSFQILKKYFKVYISGFEGAVDMRQKFMETNSYEEALDLTKTLLMSS